MRGGVWLGVGLGAAPLLAACGADDDPRQQRTERRGALPAGSPGQSGDLADQGQQPTIGDGLDPETGGAFKILNYDQYMAPGVMKSFGKQYDVEVQVTPYSNYDEMLAKIRAPGESFDLVFPGSQRHEQDGVHRADPAAATTRTCPTSRTCGRSTRIPWYDLGAQYTVPYTIYGTGVLYRADRVSSVPANGYDLIWDEQYSGKVYLLDDQGEAIGMSLLRNEHHHGHQHR